MTVEDDDGKPAAEPGAAPEAIAAAGYADSGSRLGGPLPWPPRIQPTLDFKAIAMSSALPVMIYRQQGNG